MIKLYVIIKSLLFPGAYLRCFYEQIVCRICKIPVEDNRYLRDDEMSSHIEHELAPTAGKAFAICWIPHILTLISGMLLGMIPVMVLFMLEVDDLLLTIFCAVCWWFAVSIFCSTFPSIEDAINMREKVYKNGNFIQKLLFIPGFAVTYIGAYAERYFVSFILSAVFTAVLVLF